MTYRAYTNRGDDAAGSAQSVLLAMFAAAPLFLTGVSFAMWSMFMDDPITLPQSLNVTGFMVVVALVFVPLFGMVISCVPILVGNRLLLRFGSSNPAFQLPVMWGLVGWGTTYAAAIALDMNAVLVGGLTTAGTGCALLCRTGARWQDRSIETALAARHTHVANGDAHEQRG